MEDELTGPLSLYIVIPLISIVQSSPIVSTLPRMTHNNVGLLYLYRYLVDQGQKHRPVQMTCQITYIFIVTFIFATILFLLFSL